MENPNASITDVCDTLRVSRATLYRNLEKVRVNESSDCTPPPESEAVPFQRTNCCPLHSGRNFSKRTFRWEEREVARYYTLSDKDLQIIIRHHRRDHNRLGFSIQLCHLRFPGWPLRVGEAPAPQLLACVARQLNVSPELFHNYARARDTTRREHLVELQRDFGFQPFTDTLSSKLADHLLPNALRLPKPMPLITALLDQMRAERIIVPAFSTVENLAWEILMSAEATIFGQLTSSLTLVQRRQLDPLADSGSKGLGWLRQAVGPSDATEFSSALREVERHSRHRAR
jgi:hypothetical protein